MGTFKDSLKKWFYTQSSSAASSNARIPLLNENGTPKGSDTMANLASILSGVVPVKTKTAYAVYTSTNNNRYIVITCPDTYYTMRFEAFTMSGLIEGIITVGNNQVNNTTKAKKIVGSTVDTKIYRTEGSTNNNRVVIDIAKINDQIGVILYTPKVGVTISVATSESVGSLTEVTIE